MKGARTNGQYAYRRNACELMSRRFGHGRAVVGQSRVHARCLAVGLQTLRRLVGYAMTDIAIRIKSSYDGAGTASARKDTLTRSRSQLQDAGAGKPSTAGYGDQIAAQAHTAAQAIAGLSAEEQRRALG